MGTLRRLAVIATAAISISIFAAPAANAGSVTVGIPPTPGSNCTKSITVGWNVPPGEGQQPVYTSGNVTCS